MFAVSQRQHGFVGFRPRATGRGAGRRTPYNPGRSKGRIFRRTCGSPSPLKTPPTTKGICLWNPELLPCPNQSIFNRLATKSPQLCCGLFSLFTRRHKLLPLYPNGKPIVYTGQELRTKLLRLCQPTEAATLRGYTRGHIPLCRPGVVRGPDG